MKRLFALLLAMALLLCGCNGEEEPKELKIAGQPVETDAPLVESVIGSDTETEEPVAEPEETTEDAEAPQTVMTPDFELQRHKICAGAGMTAVLHADGTVACNWMVNKTDAVTLEEEWTQWTDIVDLSIFSENMLALRSDGTVIFCGGRSDEKWWSSYTFAHDISTWKNVVQVSAGIFDVGILRADGSVEVAGSCRTSSMSETDGFTQISIGDCFMGLRTDGTVYCYYPGEEMPYQIANWKDLVQVSAGWDHVVGLRSDGTVLASGNNDEGQCDVETWRDVVQVVAGRQHTIGLCADGTVLTTGLDYYGELALDDWQDIVEIDGRYNHTVGLKSDGTLVFAGTESAFLQGETIN